MQAVVVRTLGDPGAIAIEDWPRRALRCDEARVRVHAAGVSFVDTLMIEGRYQIRPPLPFVPGCEFAGEVIEVGKAVAGLSPGAIVCGGGFGGIFAEEAVLPATRLLEVSPDTSIFEAAVIRTSYLTAWYALRLRGHLQPRESVLVLGAGGAVGIAACQLANHLQASVIAMASTPEKRTLALENGAHFALDTAQSDWRKQLDAYTGDCGVNVIVDPVGGQVAETAFRSLAWNGRHLAIGFASGTIPSIRANLALVKGAALIGVDARQFGEKEPAAAGDARSQIARLFGDGVIRPPIARIYPFEQFREALADAATGKLLGRIVLDMTEAAVIYRQ